MLQLVQTCEGCFASDLRGVFCLWLRNGYFASDWFDPDSAGFFYWLQLVGDLWLKITWTMDSSVKAMQEVAKQVKAMWDLRKSYKALDPSP